jgi:hypothetical protein
MVTDMTDTIEGPSDKQIRGAAAMLARRLAQPTLVDPYEHAWVAGKLSDDDFLALEDDPQSFPFTERRALAVLIKDRSTTPEGIPTDTDLGLILATINGTQSLDDLVKQLTTPD